METQMEFNEISVSFILPDEQIMMSFFSLHVTSFDIR